MSLLRPGLVCAVLLFMTKALNVKVADLMDRLTLVELERREGAWRIRAVNDVGSSLEYTGQRQDCLELLAKFADV